MQIFLTAIHFQMFYFLEFVLDASLQNRLRWFLITETPSFLLLYIYIVLLFL